VPCLLEQAAILANAKVARLLFAFMAEKGPVGLNAVKLFLSTRTGEFRENAELQVAGALEGAKLSAREREIGVALGRYVRAGNAFAVGRIGFQGGEGRRRASHSRLYAAPVLRACSAIFQRPTKRVRASRPTLLHQPITSSTRLRTRCPT
jgi:hypothetical protein